MFNVFMTSIVTQTYSLLWRWDLQTMEDNLDMMEDDLDRMEDNLDRMEDDLDRMEDSQNSSIPLY